MCGKAIPTIHFTQTVGAIECRDRSLHWARWGSACWGLIDRLRLFTSSIPYLVRLCITPVSTNQPTAAKQTDHVTHHTTYLDISLAQCDVTGLRIRRSQFTVSRSGSGWGRLQRLRSNRWNENFR